MSKGDRHPGHDLAARSDEERPGEASGPGFERAVAFHRRWLRARGFLDRPWFILGSAPAPTIPEHLPDDAVMVYVKYAGHSAKKFSLPPADITFLLGKTLPEQVAGLSLGHVLRLDNKLTLKARAARLFGIAGIAEGEIDHNERDMFIVRQLGSLFPEKRDKRPSNGLALICYALAVEVPEIVVAGISLDSDGHEYSLDVRERRHKGPDRQAFRAIAQRYPTVATSEKGLHEHSGLPLFTSKRS